MATITVTQISNGQAGDATVVNNNFTAIANEINGNLDNNNVKSTAAISFTKLASDPWTTYTVALTASTTNPTIGNGVLVGRYKKIGRDYTINILTTFGSTSTAGTGTYSWSLPVTAASNTVNFIGSAKIFRSGVAHYLGVAQILAGGSTVKIYDQGNTASGVAHNTPFAWANGDTLELTIELESAS